VAQHDDFAELAEPFRRDMLVFCYRMLGSFQDAEDAVQEVFIKAWRGLSTFDGRASFRTWLHRIAANTCLDLLKSRRRRILPNDVARPIVAHRSEKEDWGEPAWDLPWLEPFPDALLPEADPASQVQLRESIRLAFIRALQLLPPRQRAVLVLSDVLDWPSREVASTLQTSVAAVNSALQRARATTSSRAASDGSRLDELRLDAEHHVIASKFVDAWEQGDVDELLSLLSDDAVQMMPPMLAWFQGRAALRDAYALAWDRNPRPGIFRVLPLTLNGQLAFASYYRPSATGAYDALDLTVVEFNTDAKIQELTSFVEPNLFAKFGLPEQLS
jgi:RNA polymerase sigma-70 factor (ECF subfamily)